MYWRIAERFQKAEWFINFVYPNFLNCMKPFFQLSLLVLISTACLAQTQSGKASFYADKFEGRPTASGEKYKHSKLTAAHKTLPFGTKVRVINKTNKKTVEVVINDRGPYVEGRIIDLSLAAARALGFVESGIIRVNIEMIAAPSGTLLAEDDHVASYR